MAEKEQIVDEIVDEENEGGDEEEEGDVEDEKEVVTAQCEEISSCVKLREVMDQCTERVTSKSSTTETCTQELFDFMHCVDHCVAKNLFKQLK